MCVHGSYGCGMRAHAAVQGAAEALHFAHISECFSGVQCLSIAPSFELAGVENGVGMGDKYIPYCGRVALVQGFVWLPSPAPPSSPL